MVITPVQRVTHMVQPIHQLLPQSVQPLSHTVLHKIKHAFQSISSYNPCLPSDNKCQVITREVFRKIAQTFLLFGCAVASLTAAAALLAIVPFVGLMAGFSSLSNHCLNKHIIIGTLHKKASQEEIDKQIAKLKEAGRPVKSLTIHFGDDVIETDVLLTKIKMFSPEQVEFDNIPPHIKKTIKENLSLAGYICDEKADSMEFTKKIDKSHMQKIADWVKTHFVDTPGRSFATPLPTDSKVAIVMRGCLHSVAKGFLYMSLVVGSISALTWLFSTGSSLIIMGFAYMAINKLGNLLLNGTVVIEAKKVLTPAKLVHQLTMLIDYERPVKALVVNGTPDHPVSIDKYVMDKILKIAPQSIILKHANLQDDAFSEQYSCSNKGNIILLEKESTL